MQLSTKETERNYTNVWDCYVVTIVKYLFCRAMFSLSSRPSFRLKAFSRILLNSSRHWPPCYTRIRIILTAGQWSAESLAVLKRESQKMCQHSPNANGSDLVGFQNPWKRLYWLSVVACVFVFPAFSSLACLSYVEMVSHHPPYEAGQLPRNRRDRHVVLLSLPGHAVELSPQSLVGAIRVGNDFRIVPFLPCLQCFRFITDAPSSNRLSSFNQ